MTDSSLKVNDIKEDESSGVANYDMSVADMTQNKNPWDGKRYPIPYIQPMISKTISCYRKSTSGKETGARRQAGG